MCNIAGYVGTKPAASILIDMMRQQEGLDAGFYTGIATIHEGKIYCAKVAGPLDVLLKETDARKLPGTIGIIHSRTPGLRDKSKEWSHPFSVAPFSAKVRAAVYEACCAALREGKKTVPDLGAICEPLFDKADTTQRGAALYGVLYDIHKRGKLKVEVEYKPGVYEDAPAPVYYMTFVD